MTGIAELFASLDGSDAYEMQLEIWCRLQQARQTGSVERVKAWAHANPERARAARRERNRRYRAKFGPRQQKPRADRTAYQRAYYEANRERLKAARLARQSSVTKSVQ